VCACLSVGDNGGVDDEDTWNAIHQVMRDGGFALIGTRTFERNGGAIVMSDDRTCFSSAVIVALCDLHLISNQDMDKQRVVDQIQRHGNHINANMADVITCGRDFGCHIEFVPALPSHGLGSVLARNDATYLIVWRYSHMDDGQKVTEKHMSAWLAGKRELVDNQGLVLRITDGDLSKRGIKRLKKAIFPTAVGRIEIEALYKCSTIGKGIELSPVPTSMQRGAAMAAKSKLIEPALNCRLPTQGMVERGEALPPGYRVSGRVMSG